MGSVTLDSNSSVQFRPVGPRLVAEPYRKDSMNTSHGGSKIFVRSQRLRGTGLEPPAPIFDGLVTRPKIFDVSETGRKLMQVLSKAYGSFISSLLIPPLETKQYLTLCS